MNKLIPIFIVAILVVGAGGFFAGMQYQKSQRASFGQFNRTGNQNQRTLGNGQNGNFRPVTGEIVFSDDKSVTVKMQDGSSKIVFLSEKTSINEATSTSKQALQTGKQIMVMGTTNSDGSVTASNIQIGTAFGRGNQSAN
ncbi:MAG: hypothetical protein V1808_00470 [Candidatus Daviesbacteria bacterium]